MAYVRKAMAEAKRRTSWINPDAEYERGVASFVDAFWTLGAAGRSCRRW